MEQLPNSPHTLRAGFDHQILPFSARYVPYLPIELPHQQEVRALTVPRHGIRRRAVRQVAVLEVAGRLSDVVDELGHAIRLALAHGPRGVVCDLSAVLPGGEPIAVEMLAAAGHHVRDWPGIPVAVACPDPAVRDALSAHPMGRHLIVTDSLFSALTAVLATPYLMVQCLTLAPHPTAPRASRNFVTRTLLDWQLEQAVPAVSRAVGELVTSSSIHAGTDIDISLVWDRGALRLTVRDHGPALPGQASHLDVQKRGLTVVTGLSRSCGVLPADDGGQVLWAVFDAPRTPAPSPRSTSAARPVDEVAGIATPI